MEEHPPQLNENILLWNHSQQNNPITFNSNPPPNILLEFLDGHPPGKPSSRTSWTTIVLDFAPQQSYGITPPGPLWTDKVIE